MNGAELKAALTIATTDVDFDPDTISDEYYEQGPSRVDLVQRILDVTRDPEVLARLAVLLAEVL